MPGNLVNINNSIEFYVGDSKMDRLLRLLKKIGFQEKPKPESDSLAQTDEAVG